MIAASLLSLILLFSYQASQTYPGTPTPDSFRVQVTLVTMGVQVTDAKGRAVPDLHSDDFEIYEDGIRQSIAFFSSEEQPIDMVVLLDRSSSMDSGYKLLRAKEAARVLVNTANKATKFLYVAFDNNIPSGGEFTQDRQIVTKEIAGTSIGGGTSLYDAILYALKWCKREKNGRQVLVLISDGTDQHSTHSLEDVIQALRESQVQLYTIGYLSAKEAMWFRHFKSKTVNLSKLWRVQRSMVDVEDLKRKRGVEITSSSTHDLVLDNPFYVFRSFATETGAEVYFPRRDEELQAAVERIASDIRTQYTMSYYPSSVMTDAHYRKIKVKVKPPGLKVRTRAGYIPVPRSGQ